MTHEGYTKDRDHLGTDSFTESHIDGCKQGRGIIGIFT